MDYDFQTLSPDDFEKLITDLFTAEWGAILESYKPGKDSGIDILHSRTIKNEPRTILQCKRYPSNGFNQLKSSFKKELQKIQKLKPEKYIIVTSVALSSANKKNLIETLNPWVKDTADIYGQSEINTLLRKHPKIIKAHFKLWISSTATLERILHSRIFNLTNFTLEEMKNEMCKIVLHDGYDRALEALKNNHHCIIAGNPGIGKTTLAKILLCHYAQDDFEPIVIHNDINDAWAIIANHQENENKKLVILYDDFLGQTRFDQLKFGKNEDSLLIQLIKFTEKSNNIRFILTSREYIIADARLSHGAFDATADSITKCTINLTDYSFNHRAKVLFNHLYFSNLPKDKLEAIVESKLYKKIIDHKHFNPRIIAAISNKANSESLNSEQFLNFINIKFDNPAEIWEAPFKNEIMPLSRWILVTLWSLGGSVELENLKQAVLELSNIAFEAEAALQFSKSLKELAENFVTSEAYEHSRDPEQKVTIISFQNPSIKDFIESFLQTEETWIKTIADSSLFFAQYQELLTILDTTKSKNISSIADTLLYRNSKFESKPKGSIYRNDFGTLVFTENDIFSNNDKTLTFLKLTSLSSEPEDKYNFTERVTTQTGWAQQLENLANRGSIPYSIRRLANWLITSSLWEIRGQEIKNSFHRAFSYCINSQPYWCSELSTLNLLHDCIVIFKIELTTLEKLKIQHDANISATKVLNAENDIQKLEEVADHLEQFQKRIKFGARQIVLDIREKAESKYPDQQSATQETDVTTPIEQKEKIDIDLIFSELLH